MSGEEIIDYYSKDRNMKEYADIIKDSHVFPIITDKNGTVLSLPPLINGNHSKIKLNTKNVLIEITATDETKAKIALNIIVSMFS
jgi:phenylalanyl-tRNA synthetase beta chain